MSNTWGWLILILVVLLILAIIWWWWKERSAAQGTHVDASGSAERSGTALPAAPPAGAGMPNASMPTVDQPEGHESAHAELPSAPEPPGVAVPPATAAMSPEAAPTAGSSDDLTVIEGVGPRIDGILKANGIKTFAALAATDVQKLRAILRAANMPYADPGTWPEQAQLAAAGKMDKLQALQDSLKGGRRT